MKELNITQFTDMLRNLADFYETHPKAPIPFDFKYGWLNAYLPGGDEGRAILQSLGSFRKVFEDDYFRAEVQVGEMTLRFSTRRENICVRKVVGTKIVAETVIPSSYTPETVIPAHEEEIVEWDCGQPIHGDAEPVPAYAEAPAPDEAGWGAGQQPVTPPLPPPLPDAVSVEEDIDEIPF